jgi:two-component system sensor kinase FixL
LSIDRQGRIVLFNAAAEQIFGYAREEVIGRKVNLLMGEPYSSEHDDYIARYESTGEPRAIGRIRTVTARRKNGALFPIELSVTEISVDKDVRYAAFIRDISEKSSLQRQLVESERLAAIGTTAAKIRHELANPLNGMSLTTQLLAQRINRLSEPARDELRPTVKRLTDEITRLQRLLSAFGTISKREEYVFRLVRLSGLIDDLMQLHAPDLKEKGVEFSVSIDAALPVVRADPDKMKQAILNLIKNAGEAMPNGGTIGINAIPVDTSIVLEISDSGDGIPLDIDAFQPFVTSKRDGTGLGLVIVRQFISAHEGKISYRSTPGQGTTFRIELPHA